MTRHPLARVAIVAATLALAGARAEAHNYGQVVSNPGIEVTQSMQTLPQAAGEEFGIGLSAHKPTAIRVYLQATRYSHLLLGIHFRSADEEARQLGIRVAHWVNQKFLKPVPGN